MQLTTQQFHKNMLAAIAQASPRNVAIKKPHKLVIMPVYEANAKHSSTDDYLRLTLLSEQHIAGRLFDSEEAATFLSGPNSSYPLWIEVAPKEDTAEYALFELKISMRFRKPSELRNKETGHPPFRVVG
jgi:hypothetical protein